MRMLSRLARTDNRAHAAISLAIATAICATPAFAQAGWRTFVNPRFEYSICFPAELREAGPPPDNGDGRVFANGAGVELRVWGEYNSLEDTIASAARRHHGYFTKDGIRVTYEAKGSDWFVVSGTKGSTIIYEHARLSQDRFVTFQLTYPASMATHWNAVIPKIAKCLHDTGGGGA